MFSSEQENLFKYLIPTSVLYWVKLHWTSWGFFFSSFYWEIIVIHHCINLRHKAWWFDLHTLLLFSLSVMPHSATPWTAAHQASLPFTISWSVLKFVSIESMMPSNHLILCCPLLLLPSNFPSIRIRWPKYWSISFSISSSNEYSGLISFGF